MGSRSKTRATTGNTLFPPIGRGLFVERGVRTKGDGEGKRIKTASKAEWIYNYISSVLSVENNRLDALSRMANDN